MTPNLFQEIRRQLRVSALLTALLSAGLVHVGAAPLTEPSAIQSQPDLTAPVLGIINPGVEPVPAPAGTEPAPAGWITVTAPGPFDGYVRNADLTKQLEVKPGTAVRAAPKPDAGVLTVFAKGDKATITGLHGAWTQVRLDKSLVGYVRVAPIPATPSSSLTASGGSSPDGAASAPASPGTPASSGAMAAGSVPPSPMPPRPSPPAPPTAALGAQPYAGGPATAAVGQAYDSGDTSALPRTFEGVFVSTRRAFAPRRPYDWQVNDASGQRYAYLDITHLLLTDQIENYAGHEVTVFGTARLVPGTKDLVIQIESLRLK
jgi:hypothetical protein